MRTVCISFVRILKNEYEKSFFKNEIAILRNV